jgi:hypothetical protein
MEEEELMALPILGTIASSAGLGALDRFMGNRELKQQQAAARRKDAMANLIGSLSNRAQKSQDQQQQRGPSTLQTLARDPMIAQLLAQLMGRGGLKKFLPNPVNNRMSSITGM